jgi:hypothetical protein
VFADLLVDEFLQLVGQGDVHRRHDRPRLARFAIRS